ncbi:MAG: hypothetical protein GX053_00430 [Tissierella sp.]|nr:hypothetical protein [Tissierella sp.]
MKIYMKLILIITVLSLTLVGCTVDDNKDDTDLNAQLEEKDERIAELEEELENLRRVDEGEDLSDNLLVTTVNVLELLKDKDMDDLSDFIHPTKGVRFSPYGYVDVDNHQVFSAEEVANLKDGTEFYIWGSYDGSGESIELNFNDYYNEFIFDKDFSNPQIIGNNVTISQGNSLDNISEVYENGHFIELHFKGFDPQYEGMDWASLKLVFETVDGDWYLVGIVHDQWTI